MDWKNSSSQSSEESDREPGTDLNNKLTQDAAAIEGSASPRVGEPTEHGRRERGRVVRFNSTAAVKPPSPTLGSPASISEPAGISASKPRPSAMRNNSSNSVTTISGLQPPPAPSDPTSIAAAAAAHERAREVAVRVQERTHRRGTSRDSLLSKGEASDSDFGAPTEGGIHIPLQTIHVHSPPPTTPPGGHHSSHRFGDDSHHMVGSHERHTISPRPTSPLAGRSTRPGELESGIDELNDGQYDGVYHVPRPARYRGGVLAQLLRLSRHAPSPTQSPRPAHHHNFGSSASLLASTGTSGSDSGVATPTRRKWYEQNRSQETLANLIEASARLASPGAGLRSPPPVPHGKHRPKHKRTTSQSRLSMFLQDEEARVTAHIAETLSRQKYIIKLCRALMLFGAPTHRLEEYLSMSARVLEIEGQFLYLPGCMIISFDDDTTHTTEMRIVRTKQGIDLGKLKDVHLVYKEVMHNVVPVEAGIVRLNDIIHAKNKFSPLLRVLVFGLTSAMCAPFSFKARLIDLPLAFFFGCLVGVLQLVVSPRSELYNNVFEVSATVLVSFLARAFGSIKGGDGANGELFCFSAIAQGGIVMLLPGYAVLCSSLELQSHAIVPGSIRIVYAIIYSLLLSFGITAGAVIYGLFDSNATSALTCQNPMPSYLTFIFVPLFTICISILYQAKWRQMPVMVVIAFAGYIVNFFSSRRFVASPQIANTLGAFCVGVLANLHSRLRHGVAAAMLIPAIFVQVPGGLASTGGLLSGLTTANEVTGTNSTSAANETSLATSLLHVNTGNSNVIFDVAAAMIQIAIGIAIGLFLSALVIYPLGKRRSGLFSF